MNKTTAVAAMVAALIAGVTPLTLLNIHEQKQREVVAEEKREIQRDRAYYDCLDSSLRIKLNFVEVDGVRTYLTPEGEVFTDKVIIGAYEKAVDRCEHIREGK